MGILFDLIRQSVTARQVADLYGLQVNRHGKALCPWHNDKHPSLSFDPRTGRCKCFSCGAGGGAVDLTAVLLNISPRDAAKRINEDFGLNCDDVKDKAPSPIGESPTEIRRRERAEEQRLFCELCDTEKSLMKILRQYTPQSSEASVEFTATLKALADVQTKLDNMMSLRLER